MANLWDYLTQPSRANKPIDYSNYVDETLYNATAVPRFIANSGKSVYDSFKRGMVNPNVEDALNVAGSVMTGSLPFAPKGTGILGSGPTNIVNAYKVFDLKAKSPGELFPIKINSKVATPLNEWIDAEFIPTKGFAPRPGWHAGEAPIAPWLLHKNGQMPDNRVWTRVSMPADVDWNAILKERGLSELTSEVPKDGYYDFQMFKNRPPWKIGGSLRVDEILHDDEVAAALNKIGLVMPERKPVKNSLYDNLMELIGKK